MCSHVQRIGALVTKRVRDIANGIAGDCGAHGVKICLAVRFQLVQRVDEAQAHALGTEDVHLDDLVLGGVGAVDTVVEFDDKLGAARQRLVLAIHDEYA